MAKRQAKNGNRKLVIYTLALLFAGVSVLWVASLRIPALEDLSERKVIESTKIYDRTGEILLYDMSKDFRRALIPFEDISQYAKDAAIAIEDKDFYEHKGVKLSSFLRAVFANLSSLSFSQGGSTITQQVVKNSILTKDKTPTRKLKELILSLKLEKVLTKDEILNLYLNEIPYGGTVYGIQEASQNFFGKNARDLDVVESAYLAAIPKAPTYYSPYGSHQEELELRKNLVLLEMFESGFINQEEYESALSKKASFKPRENTGGIKAPHFVFFVIEQLTKKYGEDALQNNGFRVITTLDYSIQADAEAVAKKYGAINEANFGGTNNAIVAIDPKSGDILAMVGSRDYFDKTIDGNFNVALAHRQPGSSFKPFVYATLINKGYTPDTVLFDVPTQFSVSCPKENFTSENKCYSPGNFDNRFRGPMTIRGALAQSINVPAVKALYLAGVQNSINLAKKLGIRGLDDPNRYGLTLVLGGGEVSLLDMVSAYSVFANDGVRNPYNPIIRVEDGNNRVVDRFTSYPERVISTEVARTISDILSDNNARSPSYGPYSPLYIASRDVAVKTGTSNDFRDTWIIGYAPNLAIGAWVGNNDNTPMQKKVAGLVVAPLWREMMDRVLPRTPVELFTPPEEESEYAELKPVLRGEVNGLHSILYWVDKDNPRGPQPSNPERDSQFDRWEFGVRLWSLTNGYNDNTNIRLVAPAQTL